jgi:hypothetical protein
MSHAAVSSWDEDIFGDFFTNSETIQKNTKYFI